MPRYLVLVIEPVTKEKRAIVRHLKNSNYMGKRKERGGGKRVGELYEVSYISRTQLHQDLAMEMKPTNEFVIPYEGTNADAFEQVPEVFGEDAA